MATLSVAPIITSVSGSDPAPSEKRGETCDDRIEWRHHIVERRHRDLEPIDQARSNERDDPGGGERRESSAEEGSPGFWLH